MAKNFNYAKEALEQIPPHASKEVCDNLFDHVKMHGAHPEMTVGTHGVVAHSRLSICIVVSIVVRRVSLSIVSLTRIPYSRPCQ